MYDYLKQYYYYKNKYIAEKNNRRGDNTNIMSGGGTFFKNTTKFYFMANLTDKQIYDRLDERRAILLRGNQPKNVILHITLLQFEINQDNPDSYIFYTKDFHRNMKYFFEKTFAKYKVMLNSGFGEYDLLGQGENKFFVKLYRPDKKMVITNFRTMFYKYLESEFGKPKIKKREVNGKKYMVFSYDGHPLFAVPDFYYGRGVWTPHVSILNVGDIAKYNKPLYKEYQKKKSKKSKLQLLFTPIVNARFRPIGKIKMHKHIGNLTLSLRNPKAKIEREYIL